MSEELIDSKTVIFVITGDINYISLSSSFSLCRLTIHFFYFGQFQVALQDFSILFASRIP